MRCHEFAIMLLDYYETDTFPLYDDGQVQYYHQLSTSYQIISCSRRVAGVMNWLSYCRLTHKATHYKTCQIWLLRNWYHPSLRRQGVSNIIVNCRHIVRFLDTRNPSQTKQLFVSWIECGEEIPIPPRSVNWIQYERIIKVCGKKSHCLWAGCSMAVAC